MENKNVATFVKVTEFNNFTRAAEHLGYSQAAVTAQIKSLEQELGVLLFDRIGKGIRLTQEGKNFLPYALNMLKAEEEALHSVRTDEDLEGELRICSASSYASEILPGILLEYRKLHPKVRLRVKVSDFVADTTRKLAQGDIDFLLCLDEENAYPEFLTVAKKREPVIFVTYKKNPLLKKKRITVADVVSSQFIVSDPDIGYCASLEKELAKRDIDFSPAMEMGSVEAIINILREGFGTSFLPEFAAAKFIDSGELVKIPIKSINIDLYASFLVNKSRWLNPMMQEFIRIAGA